METAREKGKGDFFLSFFFLGGGGKGDFMEIGTALLWERLHGV